MCRIQQTSCETSKFYRVDTIPWVVNKTFVTVVTVDPSVPNKRRSASCPPRVASRVHQLRSGTSTPRSRTGAVKRQSRELLSQSRDEHATVMLRNLPNRAKEARLTDHLKNLGFGNSYETIYMPLDRKTGVNKGYAFVRFRDEAMAAEFNKKVEETQLPGSSSSKRLTASFAAYQGR